MNLKLIATILFTHLFFLNLSAQNIILQDDFEQNADNWELFTADWLGVTATMESTNGELALTNISKASTDAWHIQAVTYNLPLREGSVYKLSFDAYADAERPCHLFLGENGGDFTAYLDENITIGTEKNSYEFIFIMTEPSDDTSKFAFELGVSDASVFIDNVMLEQQNMIINGDFSASDSIHPFISFSADWLGIFLSDTVIDGVASISDITNDGGSEFWYVQLLQENLLMENGYVYFLSFDAWADADRPCHIFLGEAGGDYTPYFEKIFDITATPKNYQYEFAMYEPTDDLAKLAFELGKSGVSTYFDNISLSRIKEAPELPAAGFSMDVSSGDAPLTVQFTDESVNALSWSWDFGDGQSSEEQNPAHVYDSTGVFTVSLTVSNGYAENTFIYEDAISTLTESARENAAFGLKIYPNPATDLVHIQSAVDSPMEVSFFNSLGQLMLRKKSAASDVQVDTGNLPGGIYMIVIQVNDHTETKKLIVK